MEDVDALADVLWMVETRLELGVVKRQETLLTLLANQRVDSVCERDERARRVQWVRHEVRGERQECDGVVRV